MRTADPPVSVSIGACDNGIEIGSSTTASTPAFNVASVGPTTGASTVSNAFTTSRISLISSKSVTMAHESNGIPGRSLI